MTRLSRDIMRHSRELRVFRAISLTGTAGTQWRDDAIAARCTVSGYAFCAEPLPPDRAQAQGSPAARLVWDKGQVLLFPGRNVIGREADAAVRVDDRTISRHHAAIVIGGKTATVEDLDSKNGTFVNGQRVTFTGSAARWCGSRSRFGADGVSGVLRAVDDDALPDVKPRQETQIIPSRFS
jgi:hypothetical protein